jgi:hypothetical protein
MEPYALKYSDTCRSNFCETMKQVYVFHMIIFISDKICVIETHPSFEACQKLNEYGNTLVCATVSGV